MANKFDVKALREKVLNNSDVVYDSVYVKEWDVELPIRTIPTADLKKIMKHQDDQVRMAILGVLYGCVTQEGEKVFEDTDLAKFETEKSFGPVAKLSKEIFEISGLSETAVDEAKND